MSPTPDKANRIGRPDTPTKQVYSGAQSQHKDEDVDTRSSQSPMRCSSRQLRNGLILANVIGWMAIVILVWRLLS